MKIRTLILLVVLGIFAVGCNPAEEKEGEKTVEHEEIIAQLMSKSWVGNNVRVIKNDTIKIGCSLEFGKSTIKYILTCDSVFNYGHASYHRDGDGSYSISKDGLLVNILVKGELHALKYSKDELSGYWGKEYLVFEAIGKTE